MKRVIWGYSPKEVDATIKTLSEQNDALIKQNDYLVGKIKNIQDQLDEAKAAFSSEMTLADADNYEELKSAYAALLEKYKHLQKKTNDSE